MAFFAPAISCLEFHETNPRPRSKSDLVRYSPEESFVFVSAQGQCSELPTGRLVSPSI